MNGKVKKEIEKEIRRELATLRTLDVGSEQYVRCTSEIKKLYELREQEKTAWISGDVIVGVLAATAQVLVIVFREELWSIKSAGFAHIWKPSFTNKKVDSKPEEDKTQGQKSWFKKS